MTTRPSFLLCAGLALSGLTFCGCLPKPNTVATRTYVLAPMTAPQDSGATSQPVGPALGIDIVRMPAYLLKPSIAVRSNTNEIRYLETSLWAERLDTAFQRALAANLAALVPTDRIRIGSWTGGEVDRAVYVNVDRLDVDPSGLGTLHAWWRITSGTGEETLKSGSVRLTEPGPEPAAHPSAIASTFSRLTVQVSEHLAEAIRQSLPAPPPAESLP